MSTPNMSPGELAIRLILCLLFPPLAVFDKGCGVILLALLFTLLGWIPGVIYAMAVLVLRERN